MTIITLFALFYDKKLLGRCDIVLLCEKVIWMLLLIIFLSSLFAAALQ